ncbi:YesL family protein [Sporofaciens sp. SGI.106]|uniref:YesL family protein n=1 Tax=Sporofaciens sp. SGI.106 TaxID=3420568 RepID=UPI003D06EF05
MNRLFSYDNPVMQFISKIFDLVILNLIFIFSCIPVFTVGASLCALNYVSLKMVRNEDPYIWKNFWESFRQNFKQGTLVWILTLLVCTFLGMDFYIINSQDTTMFAVIRVLLWIICVILLSMFLYVFPIISHFVCSTRQAIKNALLMSIGHLPYTAVLLLVCGGIVYLCAISANAFAITIVLSGICGFSVMSFSACLLFNRIFKKYEPEETVTEEMIPEEL